MLFLRCSLLIEFYLEAGYAEQLKGTKGNVTVQVLYMYIIILQLH